MNKKTIITFFITSIILFWLNSCTKTNIEDKVKTNTWSKTETNTWKIEEDLTAKADVNKKDKIEELRKRLALKWLIIRWDDNLNNWEYISALVKYLQINKEIPDDKSILQKIGDTYFELHKYDKAYSYYIQVKDYNSFDRNKTARSLIFSKKLDEENIKNILEELNTLWLTYDELFYYKTSLECSLDFSECRKEFHDFFDKRTASEQNDQTWTTLQQEKFPELENIWNALNSYDNFQVDDLTYKAALMSWAFYENWLYSIAIETSKEILKDKKDYKPVIKILAKSYYELGLYIDAKLTLIKYKEIEPNDSEMSYFLWVVYEKLHELILSTVHLNKALDEWYPNKLEVYKRILYNYYEMDNIDKMLDVINEMVTNSKDEMTIDDFNIVIYYSLVNNTLKEAKTYTSYAIEKYPNSEVFNWYMWWILMEEQSNIPLENYISSSTWSIESTWSTDEINKMALERKYKSAEEFINKWLRQNNKNPMLNLVKGKLEMNKWNYKQAYVYFSKTVSLDENWEFWELAQSQLSKIEIKNN